MLDLHECTIVIPFLYDTSDRLKNISLTIQYLLSNLSCKIIIAEQTIDGKIFYPSEQELDKNVKYFRAEYRNCHYFHKTRLINDAFNFCVSSRYFFLHDCDAIFNLDCIYDSYQKLVDNKFQFVYPYNRKIGFVPYSKASEILKKGINNVDYTSITFTYDSTPACGLGFLCNSNDFVYCGKMNENFKMWGEEDWELLERVTKLGYIFDSSSNFACHIEHNRIIDGTENNLYIFNNKKERLKIQNMTKEELLEYINNNGMKV